MKNAWSAPAESLSPLPNPSDFSLVQGGLLFRILRWAHLSDEALMNVRPAIIVIALLAWLPLLVLSALQGQMLGGSVAVPFLLDVEVHIRFLVALPLLIIAEAAVHRRMSPLLRQFLQRRLIPENSIPRFEAALASAFRLRNSVLAEVLLIAAVYGIGILIVWRHYLALDAATWYATPSAEGSKLTLAGMWYGYVSLPIVQFLLLVVLAIVRLGASSMASVAHRVEPGSRASGSAGGLGFLAYGFAMLAAAHGALTAEIASRILAVPCFPPSEAKLHVVIFVLCLVLGPLLMFCSRRWASAMCANSMPSGWRAVRLPMRRS